MVRGDIDAETPSAPSEGASSAGRGGALRGLVINLLAAGGLQPGRDDVSLSGDERTLIVDIGGCTIQLATSQRTGLALEQLGELIISSIGYRRARAMLRAADHHVAQPPLWLVSGPLVLGEWVRWANAAHPLARRLEFTPVLANTPVVGGADVRSRRKDRHSWARVSVVAGVARATIELTGTTPIVLDLGRESRVLAPGQRLSATAINGVAGLITQPDGLLLSQVIDHPFFASGSFEVSVLTKEEGGTLAILADQRATLAPPPAEALTVVPPDADPATPWRATATERAEIDRLVALGRATFGG